MYTDVSNEDETVEGLLDLITSHATAHPGWRKLVELKLLTVLNSSGMFIIRFSVFDSVTRAFIIDLAFSHIGELVIDALHIYDRIFNHDTLISILIEIYRL